MGEVIGVGLIGCGMIGQIHADGLRKLVEDGEIRAVAAADPSESARAATQRNCPFDRLHPDADAVIADPDVDAVMITTPTATHRELVLATVAARKPLFCEKPLAPTFAVVRELAEAVAGIPAQVGFHSRFHPLHNHLRRLIESGEVGAPMGYTLRDDQYWPTGDIVDGHSSWRSRRVEAGGGALLEHSIHSVDILTWLFGAPTRVSAVTRRVFGYDVEDVAALVIEHRSGVVGTLLTIFNGVRGREERRLETFFEHAAVEVTTDFLVGAAEDSFVIQRPDRPGEHPDLVTLRDQHFESLGITRDDLIFYPYVEDRAWIHAIRAGTPPSPGFADALIAHAVVDAAYRSADTGTPTTILVG
ncbi:MAG TPA: Gfo/Idh/MocA family oxidoreductase [Acidimicrobiia bacterium]|nr:Gfo/Idh/MocA family oxidoreductase [Acidimicrobiia bacterium]